MHTFIRDLDMFISSLLNDTKFIVFQNHLEGWLKQIVLSCPRASDSVGLELVLREVAHQTGSWVMLLFLVQEPHTESHWCEEDAAGALPRCPPPIPMCSEQNHTTWLSHL